MSEMPFKDVAPERMSLGQKQKLFVWLWARLIDYAYDNGYTMSFGEGTRTNEQAEINAIGAAGRKKLAELIRAEFPELAKKIDDNTGDGSRNTLHDEAFKLAHDVNLFRDGVYLERTVDHAPLGTWWEAQHPLCRWGGRWQDGNHYSLEHAGRR